MDNTNGIKEILSVKNNLSNEAPIGVFDSGVGGLTVAREIMRQLPHENIVYFGDTARVPYGSKSKNNILRFSRQIIRFLRTKGVKAIVVACNTVSAGRVGYSDSGSDRPGSARCRAVDKERYHRCGGD